MKPPNKPLLVYVAGPTASGKTAVAIALAKWLDTEIISSDSRQFFKELNIGAAPPNAAELAEVPHHFVQHLSVNQPCNAGAFAEDALAALDTIYAKKDVAIMVGGSGLYADAVLFGFDDLPKADKVVRQKLAALHAENGFSFLQNRLKDLDPEYFEKSDVANPHRVVRALEVIETTGKTFSELRIGLPAERPFNAIIIALDVPREVLYDKINQRVDAMVAKGLEEEARQLMPLAHLQTLNTVGYKEWFAHFRGEISREAAIDLIKQNSRRFAKRQLTWLRRYQDAHWFAPAELAGMLNLIRPYLPLAD
jgi:tRNA dimethylallyltransferase